MSRLVKWRYVIKEAQKNGKFSPDNVFEASEWTSCAVGEKLEESLTQDIPGDLQMLGFAFQHAVEENKINEALKVLIKIEKFQVDENAYK